jgi:hypothetical protein
VGHVSAAVVGKRSPGQHEVDGGKSLIQVVIDIGKALVEFVADLLALERSGCRENGELGHGSRDFEHALGLLEYVGLFDIGLDLIGYQGNV